MWDRSRCLIVIGNAASAWARHGHGLPYWIIYSDFACSTRAEPCPNRRGSGHSPKTGHSDRFARPASRQCIRDSPDNLHRSRTGPQSLPLRAVARQNHKMRKQAAGFRNAERVRNGTKPDRPDHSRQSIVHHILHIHAFPEPRLVPRTRRKQGLSAVQ